MQLDSSIDRRMKDLEQVTYEIQQHRDVSDQEEQMTQQNYYELLAVKMDKSKALYDTTALQKRSRAYGDIAAGRFQSQIGDMDAIRETLEANRGKNMMIEEVLDKIRNVNPDLDVILSKCIGW